MSKPDKPARPEPKYTIRQTNQFKKDLKRLIKQGKNMTLLGEVVDTLIAGKALDAKHQDHPLSNNWKGFRNCHIEPDWVLIYKKDDGVLILTLTRCGSHSELEL
jgi:mRNA interferase YafQ